MTDSGDLTEQWTNKLVGKKLSDEPSSEIVRTTRDSSKPCILPTRRSDACADLSARVQTFCKKDLPEVSRVIPPGAMVTKDYREERLNVHVKEDGTVTHVTKG